jgi:hypothetical protein
MASNDFDDLEATRALQSSAEVRAANLATLTSWGAYNLLKVVSRDQPGAGSPSCPVTGYITLLPTLSGKTPRQMEALLGLKQDQLLRGAHIYRLSRVPDISEFLPRGYTTLVDGGRLKEGLRQDSAGYRPGHGAYQVQLVQPIDALLIKTLGRDEPFEPGLHPDVAALYARR